VDIPGFDTTESPSTAVWSPPIVGNFLLFRAFSALLPHQPHLRDSARASLRHPPLLQPPSRRDPGRHPGALRPDGHRCAAPSTWPTSVIPAPATQGSNARSPRRPLSRCAARSATRPRRGLPQPAAVRRSRVWFAERTLAITHVQVGWP